MTKKSSSENGEDITLHDVINHMSGMEQRLSADIKKNSEGIKQNSKGIAAINDRIDKLDAKVWAHVVDLSHGLRDHEKRISTLEVIRP